jgi:hypothetical protein
MKDNTFTRGFNQSTKNAEDGGKMVLVLTMAVNLFFSGAFSYMI